MAKKKTSPKKKTTPPGPEERLMLIEMCVDILASNEMGMEVNMGGNGTNCSEAANVAKEVMMIMGLTRDSLRTQILDRMDQLRADSGQEEDYDYED